MTISSPQSGWQPPTGFVAVESKVPGIQVFAPAPAAPEIPERKLFTCPQCGASTAYDPADSSITCSHCGYIQKIQASVIGEQAAVAEFTLDTLQRSVRGWGQERRELHCQSCGADLSLKPNDISTTCPFCGSNQVINRQPVQEDLRPNFLIPFMFNSDECSSKVRTWLGRGWMHPTGLNTSSGTSAFSGIYLPSWTFSADIAAAWKAEVGYERTESHYDSSSHTTHTRTVIDWRWEEGNVALPIRNLLINGTRNASSILFTKISPFDLSDLRKYDPDYLAGWQAKSYDIALEPAWEIGKAQMREMAKNACYQDIPTSHVRNFSMAAEFNEESWRLILVPIYLSTYRFQEKSYQVMVNGQTGVVAGQKPVAWWKVWLAILGLLLPGVVSSLIGLPFLAIGGVGVVPLFIGAILLVIGLIFGGIILKQAMQAGEA